MSDQTYEISEADAKKRIKEEKGSPVTSRGWEMYPSMFNLPKETEKKYWQGKEILDVGSGTKTDRPGRIFPGAKVCAIDPEFKNNSEYAQITLNTADEKRLGVVQEIPYDDNTFDHVLSSHAVPQHVFPREMPKALSEMIRVMKPTGDIRLIPCMEEDLDLEELRRAGFEVDFTQRASQGRLVVIQLPEVVRREPDLVRQLQLKVEMWKKFHEAVLPNDKIREDFDSREYAESFLEKA